MNYNKINNLFGWLCFIIATATYIMTAEPTASFWDCGEFIAAAYKLQIVHQPGAPLFLILQKIFSLLAGSDVTKVAYWMNVGSALSSGATILFLFWTITALAKKVIYKAGEELKPAALITIIGSGLVGALAYAFSDTFWFSAVESEVYAMSSLCTAIVFWAILKWDSHAEEVGADRWLIFIAYVIGLSIGVHLLNLLVIPAMALVYYFKRSKQPTGKGTLLSLFAGIVILAIIQYGIIQYLVKFAAYFDLFFVNTLGMGFGSGVFVFALLVVAATVYGIVYSIKKVKPLLNLALICFAFIMLGYSSYAMILVRAKANPALNNSDPDNAFAFLSYLNREQYGDRPLLYGQYFDSQVTNYEQGDNIYRKGDNKYEVAGRKFTTEYDRNTLLPRMYSDDPQHVGYYRDWMKLGETESPTFADNLGFLFSYQTGFMYARYFLWNFAGRQNDDQGQGNYTSGNWISGIKPIDALILGSQDNLPPSITENNAHNRLFFLPLILGLIGAFWHFKRNQKDAGVVGLLFFFTGMAIVLYLNQNPLQPRERDYAYAGSFYAFAIWIGLGVAAIAGWLSKRISPKVAGIGATVIGLLAAPILMASQEWDDHDRSEKFTTRDFAIDYLQSCAPNAILFTYGDNDTYPLWYVQEVEGVRPDVRIVNLSLLGTDWYIRQMKDKINQADPLPITMPNDKFVQGVRDVIRYYDYKLADPIEMKSLFEVLTSDNDNDKFSLQQDGPKENILPTKSFKITIDPAQVLATKTVSLALKDSITPAMQWTYNKNYVTKTELAMIDILAHNDWKRPVYFAVTVPSSNYIGLDKYLYNEGFAYRLLPLKTAAPDSTKQEQELISTDQMYNNLINKFVWGNMKNAHYLDPETTRMIATVIKSFNTLATKLYEQGRITEARKVINKSLEVVPDKNYLFYYILHRYYTADLLYKVGETKAANKLVKSTSDYIGAELGYLGGLSSSRQKFAMNDIQLGISIYNELLKITEANKQTALHAEIKKEFTNLQSKLSLNY
ncbi:glycosyltransferase family 117 protein [Arcticibacter svalbardensis]